jgi:uncharacterized low-complexity protein
MPRRSAPSSVTPALQERTKNAHPALLAADPFFPSAPRIQLGCVKHLARIRDNIAQPLAHPFGRRRLMPPRGPVLEHPSANDGEEDCDQNHGDPQVADGFAGFGGQVPPGAATFVKNLFRELIFCAMTCCNTASLGRNAPSWAAPRVVAQGHPCHISQSGRSDRALRLTSTIIAVFLALSMAIFPVSIVGAASMGGHHGTTAAGASADHGDDHEHVASSGAGCAFVIAAEDDCGPSKNASHESAPSCCGMGVCHVFQMSAAPSVSTPVAKPHKLHAPGDQQVAGAPSVRIDRPPRTV